MRLDKEYANKVSKEFQEKTNNKLLELNEQGAKIYYTCVNDYNGCNLPGELIVDSNNVSWVDIEDIDALLMSLSGVDEEIAPVITVMPDVNTDGLTLLFT